MVSDLVIISGISMFFVVCSTGFIVWILWDRGKVAVEYRDQETGKVDWVKSRPKDDGVPFDVKGYPTHKLRPDSRKMGTWSGGVMPWDYPLITIDPHTGQQFETRVVGEADEELPDPLKNVEAELLSIPWAHVYWKWIDSKSVEQALDSQKPVWAQMQGALIIGMVVISFAFLGWAWLTQGGG